MYRPGFNKPIVLTEHALNRVAVRKFAEEDVHAVLRNPSRMGQAKDGAKFAEALLPSGRILRVIFDDSGLTIRVVTVVPRRRLG